MLSRALLALLAAALSGCGNDPGTLELPVCLRESYVGPVGQPAPAKEVVCGLTGPESGWRISGPGPVYDAKRTLVAMDQPLGGKVIRAECELRDHSGRIDDRHVWAQLASEPARYCKVRSD